MTPGGIGEVCAQEFPSTWRRPYLTPPDNTFEDVEPVAVLESRNEGEDREFLVKFHDSEEVAKLFWWSLWLTAVDGGQGGLGHCRLGSRIVGLAPGALIPSHSPLSSSPPAGVGSCEVCGRGRDAGL